MQTNTVRSDRLSPLAGAFDTFRERAADVEQDYAKEVATILGDYEERVRKAWCADEAQAELESAWGDCRARLQASASSGARDHDEGLRQYLRDTAGALQTLADGDVAPGDLAAMGQSLILVASQLARWACVPSDSDEG